MWLDLRLMCGVGCFTSFNVHENNRRHGLPYQHKPLHTRIAMGADDRRLGELVKNVLLSVGTLSIVSSSNQRFATTD